LTFRTFSIETRGFELLLDLVEHVARCGS